MTKSKTNPKVDFFFAKAKKWKGEFEKLRMIVLGCGLTEELRWGCPCYTFQKSNIVLIHGFKEYCALLFFKGVFLKDAKGILIQQTKNVQAARQIRFTDAGTATSIPFLFFATQTIQNAGVAGRKMYAANSQWKRIER